jgi:hypothetical protein
MASTTPSEDILVTGRLIVFHPITIQYDNQECIVGDASTGEFVAIPEIGGKAIELLQSGMSTTQVHDYFEEALDVELDVEEFVDSLVDLGFVKSVDGQDTGNRNLIKPNLAYLNAHHVQWLFTPLAKGLFLMLFLGSGLTLVFHPELIPKYQDYFWLPSTSLVVAGNTFVFIVNAIFHELSHLIAARSLAVPAKISLSTRLQNLVVQTDVTGLWGVPRKLRYRVYLAGIFWDLVPISFSILALAYFQPSPLTSGFLKAVVLMNFFSIMAQFRFFSRTDIYFVILDLMHCRNLFEDSLDYLKYIIQTTWRKIARKDGASPNLSPLEKIPAHEHSKIKVYAWLVLLGSSITLGIFAFYDIPILISLFSAAVNFVWIGITQRHIWHFLDGMVTLFVEGGIQLAFIIVFIKNRKEWLLSVMQKVRLFSGSS